MTSVEHGLLRDGDPNYGTPVECYVCSTPHSAHGLARITDKSGITDVPLCPQCVQNPDDVAVLRIYWNAPDLEVSEGGDATTDQILAVSEKIRRGTTQH